MRRINLDKGKLFYKYFLQKKSTYVVAKEMMVSQPIVYKNLLRYGFMPRSNSDAKRLLNGRKSPKWKCGYTKSANGYVYNTRTHQLQHREKIEEYLGRKLSRGEAVHHIDGDRTNNKLDNLELMDRSEHQRMHSLMRWRMT